MAALHPSTTRMSETISATELHHSMGHYCNTRDQREHSRLNDRYPNGSDQHGIVNMTVPLRRQARSLDHSARRAIGNETPATSTFAGKTSHSPRDDRESHPNIGASGSCSLHLDDGARLVAS